MASPVAFALVLSAGATGCSEQTPGGGLLVVMNVDSSLSQDPPNRLTVDVGSLDGGTTYRDAGYSIDDAGGTGRVRFPTSLGIDSNGDPNAAVSIELGVWDGTERIDFERYRITNIPTANVHVLPVLFGLPCAASGPSDGGTLCPLESWGCTWDSLLDLWSCDAERLPPLGADAGLSPSGAYGAGDAAPDATTGDASAIDATSEEDAGLGVEAETGEEAGAAPSCSGGGPGAGPNCGGSPGSDDCCASNEVPSGAFLRDYDGITYLDDSHPATVSQLRLDRYEVTVGRFRAFVDAISAGDGGTPWTPPSGSGKHTHLNHGNGLSNGGDGGVIYETGWDMSWNAYLPQAQSDWDAELLSSGCTGAAEDAWWTWTTTAGGNENRPINCVNWYEAYAFCIWDGGFLPSQTEWDYIAAGGSNNQYEYAWGNDPPDRNASHAIYGCYWPPRTTGNDCQGIANIALVGSVPNGGGTAVWGQLDLTGSVYEWVLDYGLAPYALPCVDCAETSSGTQREFRGGGFDSNDTQLFNSFPNASVPENSYADVGVRCARPP
ncbi:MAG: formylglycine-generating enzyme family protein [Polyangiaceae bacterium]